MRRRYLCSSSAVDTVLRIFSEEAYPVSGFRVKLLGHVDKLGLGILIARRGCALDKTPKTGRLGPTADNTCSVQLTASSTGGALQDFARPKIFAIRHTDIRMLLSVDHRPSTDTTQRWPDTDSYGQEPTRLSMFDLPLARIPC